MLGAAGGASSSASSSIAERWQYQFQPGQQQRQQCGGGGRNAVASSSATLSFLSPPPSSIAQRWQLQQQPTSSPLQQPQQQPQQYCGAGAAAVHQQYTGAGTGASSGSPLELTFKSGIDDMATPVHTWFTNPAFASPALKGTPELWGMGLPYVNGSGSGAGGAGAGASGADDVGAGGGAGGVASGAEASTPWWKAASSFAAQQGQQQQQAQPQSQQAHHLQSFGSSFAFGGRQQDLQEQTIIGGAAANVAISSMPWAAAPGSGWLDDGPSSFRTRTAHKVVPAAGGAADALGQRPEQLQQEPMLGTAGEYAEGGRGGGFRGTAGPSTATRRLHVDGSEFQNAQEAISGSEEEEEEEKQGSEVEEEEVGQLEVATKQQEGRRSRTVAGPGQMADRWGGSNDDAGWEDQEQQSITAASCTSGHNFGSSDRQHLAAPAQLKHHQQEQQQEQLSGVPFHSHLFEQHQLQQQQRDDQEQQHQSRFQLQQQHRDHELEEEQGRRNRDLQELRQQQQQQERQQQQQQHLAGTHLLDVSVRAIEAQMLKQVEELEGRLRGAGAILNCCFRWAGVELWCRV